MSELTKELFNHILDEYNLLLFDIEIQEIIDIVLKHNTQKK